MNMDSLFFKFARSFCVLMLISSTVAAETKSLYENNFESAAVGTVPDELLVQDGQFAVRELEGNKVLELPGAPLETFGVLFGPNDKSDILVSGRILGTGKGRRFPTFGIGANGLGAYKLQVSPAKKILELYKGEVVVKSAPFDWKSGEWTELRLQVRKEKDGLKVEGKAWAKGGAEPKDSMIVFDDQAPPAAGPASIWGSPFSGTPIQFDDLQVRQTPH